MSQAFYDGFEFQSNDEVFPDENHKGDKYIEDFRRGMDYKIKCDEEEAFWEDMDKRATLGFQYEFEATENEL